MPSTTPRRSPRRFSRAVLSVGLLGLGAIGCPKSNDAASGDAGAGPATAPSASASASAAANAANATGLPDDAIRPVYATAWPSPDPVASRFCKAIHEAPEAKRAACCGIPPVETFVNDCTTKLSQALADKAITLDLADVDRCAAAIDKTFAGCDWVGPFAPPLPTECDGILRGTLAAGAKCRSSLECTGALICLGVSPTHFGKCAPTQPDGKLCGTGQDPLAPTTRQNAIERTHPECSGTCEQHHCAPFLAEGAACKASVQCGPGRTCIGAKCTSKSAPKAGEACAGNVCAEGLVCSGGKCGARKAAGAACTTDFECLGGCVKGDGGAARCGPRCDVR